MDFLKATINSEVKKRKKLYEQAATQDKVDGPKKKYVRVADLERASEPSKPAKEASKPADSTTDPTATATTTSRNSETSDPTPHPLDVDSESHGAVSLGPEETIKRLRARNEPIRLFGESDMDRRRRLRNLELSEERSEGQQNEFRRVLAQVEQDPLHHEQPGSHDKRRQKLELLQAQDTSELLQSDLIRRDPNRLQQLLYVYFKRLLYEWHEDLLGRSEDERQSAEGKVAMATQRQTADYLRPLFRSLRQRSLAMDILARVAEIAARMLEREYMRANDAYLQLSIGNAPWPLGVTQVGIHARAARENINANKVAHVLNDEVQRKWIQSIKRLMRFAQTMYPPDDLAKMVG
ncbi:hypothetical protein GGI07_002452 [Coemansia sp. Benny D115]|nr:hypothetical protein GGI07_002452 [Coemansia sp. Benny D115]